MSPALGDSPQQGTWHQGWGGGGGCSHLLGFVLLGAPRLLAGAVGHRRKRCEGFQPSAAPREDESLRPSTTPIFGWGERSAFCLAPEAAPPPHLNQVKLGQQHPS